MVCIICKFQTNDSFILWTLIHLIIIQSIPLDALGKYLLSLVGLVVLLCITLITADRDKGKSRSGKSFENLFVSPEGTNILIPMQAKACIMCMVILLYEYKLHNVMYNLQKRKHIHTYFEINLGKTCLAMVFQSMPITSVRRSWSMQIKSDLWKVPYMWW